MCLFERQTVCVPVNRAALVLDSTHSINHHNLCCTLFIELNPTCKHLETVQFPPSETGSTRVSTQEKLKRNAWCLFCVIDTCLSQAAVLVSSSSATVVFTQVWVILGPGGKAEPCQAERDILLLLL